MTESKKHAPTTAHNYLAKMEELYRAGSFPPGSLSEAEVMHDDWCDALNARGFCNCEPDIVIERHGDS